MNSDIELDQALKQLRKLGNDFYSNNFFEDNLREAKEIIYTIRNYIYEQQNKRLVQTMQIDDNIWNIQRILGKKPIEGQYSYIAKHIDNLWFYSGAKK